VASVYSFTDRPLKNSSELLYLFAEGVNLLDPFSDMCHMAKDHTIFRGDVDTFKWMLRLSNSTHKSQSAESCVQFLLKLCSGPNWYYMPSSFHVILEGRERNDDLNDALRNVEDENGDNLLIHVAWRFALGYSLYPKNYEHHARRNPSDEPDPSHKGQTQIVQLSEYMSLLTELIMAGSHLHKTSAECSPFRPRTPLLMIISAYFSSFLFRDGDSWEIEEKELDKRLPDECTSAPTVPAPVHIWLNLLASASIDLVEYGRREKQLHLESLADVEFFSSCRPRRFSEKLSGLHFRLAHFTYGPLPGDWKFYFVQEWCIGSDWLVEFWEMVEHPERAMPGAWND
jgi:hypothetical protein